MRVSASAMVHGSREWLLWADGKTYASVGAAQTALERLLPTGTALRRAIESADEAEQLFRAAFVQMRADPNIIREDSAAGASSVARGG
jgi:hypothetical protein